MIQESIDIQIGIHLQSILDHAIQLLPHQNVLVIYDDRSELSLLLTKGYQTLLPRGQFFDFETNSATTLLAAIDNLKAKDLVIMVQSSNFRLESFRLRIELFRRHLKVIEHMHLEHMVGKDIPIYVDALKYDKEYFRGTGRALQTRIDQAKSGRIESGNACLNFYGGFESSKVNIGDYTDMKNVGGLFPIGEVFTEARDLTQVEGQLNLFAFADTRFQVSAPETPILVDIEKGRIVRSMHATEEWEKVLDKIRLDEGEIWVREIGFGLNKAMTPSRKVQSIGAYERMCGIHLSLGAKHAVYPKPGFGRHTTRHHVDVFAQVDKFWLDDFVVFTDGNYTEGHGVFTLFKSLES